MVFGYLLIVTLNRTLSANHIYYRKIGVKESFGSIDKTKFSDEAGQNEKAIANLNKAVRKAPNDLLSYIGLVLAYSYSGQPEQANSAAEEVLRINPKFTVAAFMKRSTVKDQSANDRMRDALIRSGLN